MRRYASANPATQHIPSKTQMNLDINTPRGQESVAEETEMFNIIKSKNPSCQFFHTPITKASLIDGFITQKQQLLAIYEAKCRRHSLETFQHQFQNEWMISSHKLLAGAQLSKMLEVPFVGYLYIVPNKIVLSAKITNDKGRFIIPIRFAEKQTSASCNGGIMQDTCGFINLQRMKIMSDLDQ